LYPDNGILILFRNVDVDVPKLTVPKYKTLQSDIHEFVWNYSTTVSNVDCTIQDLMVISRNCAVICALFVVQEKQACRRI